MPLSEVSIDRTEFEKITVIRLARTSLRIGSHCVLFWEASIIDFVRRFIVSLQEIVLAFVMEITDCSFACLYE